MVQTRQSTRQNNHNKTYGLSPKELECARILLSMKEKEQRKHKYNLRPPTNVSYRGMDGETEWFKQTRYNLRIH